MRSISLIALLGLVSVGCSSLTLQKPSGSITAMNVKSIDASSFTRTSTSI